MSDPPMCDGSRLTLGRCKAPSPFCQRQTCGLTGADGRDPQSRVKRMSDPVRDQKNTAKDRQLNSRNKAIRWVAFVLCMGIGALGSLEDNMTLVSVAVWLIALCNVVNFFVFPVRRSPSEGAWDILHVLGALKSRELWKNLGDKSVLFFITLAFIGAFSRGSPSAIPLNAWLGLVAIFVSASFDAAIQDAELKGGHS